MSPTASETPKPSSGVGHQSDQGPNGETGPLTNLEAYERDLLSKPEAREEYERSLFAINVGRRIRDARDARGLSQEELARLTGMTQPNIARLELGGRTASLPTLARIANALDISPDAPYFPVHKMGGVYSVDERLTYPPPEAISEKVHHLIGRIGNLLNGPIDAFARKQPQPEFAMPQLGQVAPDFQGGRVSGVGVIDLYELLRARWGVLVFLAGDTSAVSHSGLTRLVPDTAWDSGQGARIVVIAPAGAYFDASTLPVPQTPVGPEVMVDVQHTAFDRYGIRAVLGEPTESIFVVDPHRQIRLTMTRPAGTTSASNVLGMVESLRIR